MAEIKTLSARLLFAGETFTKTGIGQSVDGRTVAEGDEVFFPFLIPREESGLYVASSGDWDRHPDFATSEQMKAGTAFFIREGSTYAFTEWYHEGPDNRAVDVDGLYFRQRSTPAPFVEGAGIDISGNTIQLQETGVEPDTVSNPTITYNAYGQITYAEASEMQRSYIEGLGLYYVDATTVGLSAGRAYVPGLERVLEVWGDQTATVPGGANALYFAYLEEYPAGSGEGRLRLITTAPGEPYLGTARRQSDDEYTRYLGMLRKDDQGNLIPFQCEILGGSTVLYEYTIGDTAQALAAIQKVVTQTTANETEVIGPDAIIPQKRLVSPAAETIFIRYWLYRNATAVTSVRIGWASEDNLFEPPATFVLTYLTATEVAAAGYHFAIRLSPDQELACRVADTNTQVDIYVTGYYERR